MATSALNELRSEKNLNAVWRAYWRDHKKSAAGIDRTTPKDFNEDLPRKIRLLSAQIREGYLYSPLRAIPIDKKDSAKKRLICIPTINDRIVQRAILKRIEEKAEKLGILNDVSFGFVKEVKGAKAGAHGARNVAVQGRAKAPWAFKADISAFFDSIPRERLINEFKRSFSLRG